MTRTGNAARAWGASLALLAAAGAGAAPSVEFYQTVDRDEVGTDDTFHLTVVSSAGDDGELQLPSTEDFEVLSRSQSTQMSLQMGGGGRFIQRKQTYQLLMRANRAGKLVIPPAVLKLNGKTYRTESVTLTVRTGRLSSKAPPPRPRDPFDDFSQAFPGFPRDLEERFGVPDMNVPRSDSDLFLRASLDRPEVFVGEQVTYSVFIFSRVDLSSVDAVSLPKLDGFWSEDLENPSQLTGQEKVLDGVPYRAYLLKRRALFPVKPGALSIGAAEADITTGFLFAGHKFHRKSNDLTVRVKALPPGAPQGFSSQNVGSWKITAEASAPEVELGTPLTVKVSLEGVGNVRNVSVPKLKESAGVRVYAPSSSEKVGVQKGRFGGRRTQEYLVTPQQTGTVTFPPMRFDYFDPSAGEYKVSEIGPLTVRVTPGDPSAQGVDDGAVAKNVLTGGGLRPMHRRPGFGTASGPVWTAPWFWPAVVAPALAYAALLAAAALTRRAKVETPDGTRRKKASAAERRLRAAREAKAASAAEFYGEVEKAVGQFLEARLHLGAPFAGMTRDALSVRMGEQGVAAERQAQVLALLDRCDVGRYSPGATLSDRDAVLKAAAAVMEGWV